MKFGQQENIRVKQQIVDGFFEQLKEQPFSEIRVAQLIKSAGVARVSYYRNFDSIEDILTFYLTCLVTQHHEQEKKSPIPHNRTRETMKMRFTTAFVAFKSQEERFMLLIDRGLSSHIYEFFVDFGEIIKAKHPEKKNHFTYKHIFVFGASFHVMMAWLQNGAKESPEEMADFLVNTLPDSFFDNQKSVKE
ncbi:DNA-binding transcriptional repressor FabR [Fructobacillus sp. EFB-N1]|uniref:TetR/AcrR family transcriptional regulator n=1 Tax=Fructobacillus TaxID=559173 RepID=UPI00065D1E3A|nr:TetR/AcrR family transcriptional regulator [Fructobacillus sp. EFB-N1]KMK53687.1 DNA-binding transcriptional repressor FabR [Fructobacillus sp. EFB-N1]CAK1222210.1 AcrR family [Fructobacillus cardui]